MNGAHSLRYDRLMAKTRVHAWKYFSDTPYCVCRRRCLPASYYKLATMDWERHGVGPPSPSDNSHAAEDSIPKIRVDRIDKYEANAGLPQSKSESDLGGPTVSMPDITFALTDSGDNLVEGQPEESQGGVKRSASKLNVYCSPRMTRRSFQDGDTSSNQECWLDGFEPSRSLLSLRSSTQLGSTTSLDTNFTGRSLGLLSDDSDRTFLSDKPVVPNSPTRKLLRRFFSNPENCPGGDATINRSSKSWTNLKEVQMACIDIEEVEKRLTEEGNPSGPSEIQAILENLNRPGRDSPQSFDLLCEDSMMSNFVSSRRTQKALSEGRIRQWLHDLSQEQQQAPTNDGQEDVAKH